MEEFTQSSSQTLHVLAYLFFRMGLDERADRIYAALDVLAPADGPDRRALCGRAAVAVRRNDGAAALEFLRRAMPGRPLSSSEAPMLLLKAQALWSMGRQEEARSARDEYLALAGRGALS